MSSQHHPTVAVNFPDHVPDALQKGRTVVTRMTGNAHFSSPNPPLATVTAALNALDAAESETKTSKGAIPARNAALAQVKLLMRQLGDYVQLVADGADEDQAESIIASASLDVHHVKPRGPQLFHVEQGPPGTVVLFGVRVDRATAYSWQTSVDGKTWTNLPPTSKAKTTVTGLTPGVTAYFRHQPVLTHDTPAEWSQVISILVK
jgi:hypothetical protein